VGVVVWVYEAPPAAGNTRLGQAGIMCDHCHFFDLNIETKDFYGCTSLIGKQDICDSLVAMATFPNVRAHPRPHPASSMPYPVRQAS
jgi:hypothetical protein